VLGDMAELGRDSAALHAGLRVDGLDAVLLLGAQMRYLAASHAGARHMDDVGSVEKALRGMGLNENDTLLVKGSRCMRMERVIDALKEGGDAV